MKTKPLEGCIRTELIEKNKILSINVLIAILTDLKEDGYKTLSKEELLSILGLKEPIE